MPNLTIDRLYVGDDGSGYVRVAHREPRPAFPRITHSGAVVHAHFRTFIFRLTVSLSRHHELHRIREAAEKCMHDYNVYELEFHSALNL